MITVKTIFARFLLIASAAWVSTAQAADFDMHLFGRHVKIIKTDDSQYSLRIDDREVLKNYYVDLDEVHVVGGIGVIVGISSAGGNACEGSPFVVSFPKDANPRVDGPLDSCYPVTVKPSDEMLTFSTAATPNEPGQRWEWTSAAGFKDVKGEAFVADSSKGWDQLRERSVTHPAGLLDYAEIGAEISRLAGADQSAGERHSDRRRLRRVQGRPVRGDLVLAAHVHGPGGGCCRRPRIESGIPRLEAIGSEDQSQPTGESLAGQGKGGASGMGC